MVWKYIFNSNWKACIYLTISLYLHIKFRMVTQYIQSKIYIDYFKRNYQNKTNDLLIYTCTALVFIYTTLPLLQKKRPNRPSIYLYNCIYYKYYREKHLVDKMYYLIQFEFTLLLTICLKERCTEQCLHLYQHLFNYQ